MPKSDNQKLKILYILDYLQKNSHENKPVRASELMQMLEYRHNIHCERKTIYSDIAALIDYGVDIITKPGKNGGYYIASRNFELPELKAKLENGEGKSVAIQKRLLEKLEAQMEEFKAQEEKQYDLLETGKYTQELFDRRNAALRQKMEDCQKQIFETRTSMPKEVDYAESIVTLEEAIAALKDDTVSIQVQNQLLKKIVDRIDITTYPLPKRNVGVDLKIFLRL